MNLKGDSRRVAVLFAAAAGLFLGLLQTLPAGEGKVREGEGEGVSKDGATRPVVATAGETGEAPAARPNERGFREALAQLQSLNSEARLLRSKIDVRRRDQPPAPAASARAGAAEGPEAGAAAGFPAAASNTECTKTLAGLGQPFNKSDPYQCRQTDVVLVHIPKAGGTSIEKAGKVSRDQLLWGVQYDLPRFRQRRRGLPKTIKSKVPVCRGNFGKRCCSWWHVPPRYMLDWRPYYSAPKRFCAVRNPYARALSEYSFRHGKAIRKLTCDQLNHTEVNAWLRARMQAQVDGTGPDQFTTLDDCHWYPQYQYVEPGVSVDGTRVAAQREHAANPYIAAGADGRSCNHVIKLENFSVAFPLLMAQLGIPGVVLPKSKGFKSGCSDLGILEEETRRMVRATYRQDFEQFGYPF